MNFTELESERLHFRKFREDDAETVFRWASNPENIKYTRFDGNRRLEESQAFVGECIALAEADPCLDFEFIAELKDTGQVIGSVQIICRDEYEASLGYLLLPEHWGQGYGTESVKTLIDFGFRQLKLHRIATWCDAENRASYHVMEKAGMRREGYFVKNRRGNAVLGHEWRDELAYAILREEWETSEQKKVTLDSAVGCLHEYANPALILFEKDAWPMAAVEKHIKFLRENP